jgi:putative FmdB family regulatory protein
MPTYEYRCPSGHDFEHFAKISESKSELPCPVCGAVAARRISGGAGLLFKGTGFYITDYGKDGKKDQKAAAAKASEGSSGGGGGGESKGGEAKSESKGESKGGEAKSGGDAAKPAAAAPSSAKPSSSSSGGDA